MSKNITLTATAEATTGLAKYARHEEFTLRGLNLTFLKEGDAAVCLVNVPSSGEEASFPISLTNQGRSQSKKTLKGHNASDEVEITLNMMADAATIMIVVSYTYEGEGGAFENDAAQLVIQKIDTHVEGSYKQDAWSKLSEEQSTFAETIMDNSPCSSSTIDGVEVTVWQWDGSKVILEVAHEGLISYASSITISA